MHGYEGYEREERCRYCGEVVERPGYYGGIIYWTRYVCPYCVDEASYVAQFGEKPPQPEHVEGLA